MSKLTNILRIARSLPWSLYFNLRYLPLRQALKLPILLYKPRLRALRGTVSIAGPVSTGMIRLGFPSVSLYPSRGVMIENHGGRILFEGPCYIGSGSAISVGPQGQLRIGARVMANAEIKIVAYHSITIADECRLAWETLLLDSDMHTLTRPDGSTSRGYAPIELGTGCWVGTRCMLLKGTRLPAHTTVQAGTVVSGSQDIPERSVIGPETAIIVKASDTYRDLHNDTVAYPPLP